MKRNSMMAGTRFFSFLRLYKHDSSIDLPETKQSLHKVVLPAGVPMLITRGGHVLLGKNVIVRMVLLPFPFFPLLRLLGFFFFPGCLRLVLPPPQLLQHLVPLVLQIRLPLHLCLVEPVDDGVLARGDKHAPHLAGVLEAHLADVHGAVLFEVRPGGVYHGHVVLFIALDGIRLGQLRQVREEMVGEGVPRLAVVHAEVDVRAGELVDVEPDVLFPAVFDEVLIFVFVFADVDEGWGLDGRGGEVVDHCVRRVSCVEIGRAHV